MTRKTLQILGALLAIVVIVPLGIFAVFSLSLVGGGSYEYSGAGITPDVLKHCPAYVRINGARVLHIQNIEGMNGGQKTIEFELPPDRLPAFLAGSPLKDAVLESKYVPLEFRRPKWLTRQRSDELEKTKMFSAASILDGRTHYAILVDRTRSDVYVIYLQTTS